MDRSWWWKAGLCAAVALLSIWFLIPSYYSLFVLPKDQRNDLKALQDRLPKWAPDAKHRINLGLDLQGGIHMVMRVDTRTALQKRTDRRGLTIVNYLKEKKLGGDELTYTSDPDKLQVTLVGKPELMQAVAKEVSETFNDFSVGNPDGGKLTLSLKESTVTKFREDAIDQALLTIRKRIDKWGVAEADIRKQGGDSIVIALPGRSDPEKAKELIGTTAQLEFRMVDDANPQFFQQLHQSNPPPADSDIKVVSDEGFPQLESKNREALLNYVASTSKVPADREVLLECKEGLKKGTCDSYRTYLLEKSAPVTGDSLAGADASLGQMNEPEVNFQFDAQGGRDFATLTEKNVGRRMAIVLDGNVNSAPRINEKIPGGRGRITMGRRAGRSTQDVLAEANTLSLVLKAGALPAPVTVGEIRQVGASLGEELIKKGALAAVVGLALVIIFMAIYYKGAGLTADVALVLNGVLILMFLSLLNATLTLPGIAGFILTLGIAVDANVLINERIREEIRNGKTARAAVDQGYDRAFWTIFDAHVTTLIAGIILFFTGTGPVQGFATTLIIGIISSLFTSIVVTRVITTYLIHGRNAQKVSV
ncbi:MAG: protein translocase subunit SecD [Myxococcaceae bacterium]